MTIPFRHVVWDVETEGFLKNPGGVSRGPERLAGPSGGLGGGGLGPAGSWTRLLPPEIRQKKPKSVGVGIFQPSLEVKKNKTKKYFLKCHFS